jgi:hypothetical protein
MVEAIKDRPTIHTSAAMASEHSSDRVGCGIHSSVRLGKWSAGTNGAHGPQTRPDWAPLLCTCLRKRTSPWGKRRRFSTTRTSKRPRILSDPTTSPAVDDRSAFCLSGGLAIAVAPPAVSTSAGGASSRFTLAGFLNIPQRSTWRLYLTHPIRAYEVPNGHADDTSPIRCPPARSANTCQVDQEAGDDTWMTRA